MKVVDGRGHFDMSLDDAVRGNPWAFLARRADVRIPPTTHVSDTPPLKARVNHNRWIVDCPDCAGAEFVWLDKPLMMCAECFNVAVERKWRRVVLPNNVAAIETVLKARPIPHTRNWVPGETVSDLKRENKKRGLPEVAP